MYLPNKNKPYGVLQVLFLPLQCSHTQVSPFLFFPDFYLT